MTNGMTLIIALSSACLSLSLLAGVSYLAYEWNGTGHYEIYGKILRTGKFAFVIFLCLIFLLIGLTYAQ